MAAGSLRSPDGIIGRFHRPWQIFQPPMIPISPQQWVFPCIRVTFPLCLQESDGVSGVLWLCFANFVCSKMEKNDGAAIWQYVVGA